MSRSHYKYTSQKQLRSAFWKIFPEADRKKIMDYSGKGKMYKTDTRITFSMWLEALRRNGEIDDALCQRATL
jgi:hypothetical protein